MNKKKRDIFLEFSICVFVLSQLGSSTDPRLCLLIHTVALEFHKQKKIPSMAESLDNSGKD